MNRLEMGEGFESVEKAESEHGQENDSVGGVAKRESVDDTVNSVGEEGACDGTVGKVKVKWSDGEIHGAYSHAW